MLVAVVSFPLPRDGDTAYSGNLDSHRKPNQG